MKYSLLSMARNALSGHRNWPPAWRQAELKPRYDIVIVGGGGHGLATAYYLAKNHGLRNIAVLEKGWIVGGNTGRNTTIVRSNYLFAESTRFYDFSLQLYEGLSRELNYNLMFGQRGVLNLAYSRLELRQMNRRVNALRHQGIEAEMLDLEAVLSCSVAAAPAGMTLWPGATPAPPVPWVWTSSRTAPSRALMSKTEMSPACRPGREPFRQTRCCWLWPAIPACWRHKLA